MRILIVAFTALGVFATASFGAMAMGGALIAVGLFRLVGRQVVALVIVLVSAAMLLVLLFGFEVQLEADESTLEVNETVNQQRFDRSRDGRLQLWSEGLAAWTDSPFGVGPDGVKQRQIGLRGSEGGKKGAYEIHADALGYLVERGFIGIIGYVGLWVVLWRGAEKRGFARALIIALLVAGMFRETMHYRHTWLLLAVAFAIDYQYRRSRGSTEAPASEPASLTA
jgi:O-antigen ligase